MIIPSVPSEPTPRFPRGLVGEAETGQWRLSRQCGSRVQGCCKQRSIYCFVGPSEFFIAEMVCVFTGVSCFFIMFITPGFSRAAPEKCISCSRVFKSLSPFSFCTSSRFSQQGLALNSCSWENLDMWQTRTSQRKVNQFRADIYLCIYFPGVNETITKAPFSVLSKW